ncbi:MAG: hypothetical protein KKC19_03260 [Nanoarchaeota archaeon]|nr:hypothetical protein [Nanoarchaeota archaeon]
MTEQEQTPDYSTFEKYQYGALAARFLNQKDEQSARSSLELLAGKGGLNLGEEAEGFIRGTQASEKGIQTATEIYSGKFGEAQGGYSPSDLSGWYSDILSDLGGDESARITQYLKDFSESYEGIIAKMVKADHILKGRELEASNPEQITEAEETFKKYGNLTNLVQKLTGYKFDILCKNVTVVNMKNELGELASKFPEVKTEEPAEHALAA